MNQDLLDLCLKIAGDNEEVKEQIKNSSDEELKKFLLDNGFTYNN